MVYTAPSLCPTGDFPLAQKCVVFFSNPMTSLVGIPAQNGVQAEVRLDCLELHSFSLNK